MHSRRKNGCFFQRKKAVSKAKSFLKIEKKNFADNVNGYTFALPITQDTRSEEREREKRKKRKFFEDIGDSEACSKYPLIYEK